MSGERPKLSEPDLTQGVGIEVAASLRARNLERWIVQQERAR